MSFISSTFKSAKASSDRVAHRYGPPCVQSCFQANSKRLCSQAKAKQIHTKPSTGSSSTQCAAGNEAQQGCRNDSINAVVQDALLLKRRQLLAAAALATAVVSGAVQSGAAAAEELALLPTTSAAELNSNEQRVLEINQRVQAQNSAPKDFPSFVRTGYSVKVLGDEYAIRDDGLIYKDFEQGTGSFPSEGQEVTFHYTAYNESGSRIDSTYLRGRPAQTRIGVGGLIPGFEEGLKGMKVGGKRRIVVPPDLGPPVGPATFFSAKQFEVFDVELVALRNCQRTQTLMFSSIVCEDV